MLELIGSTEFGDWLLGEHAQATQRARSKDVGLSQAAGLRLDKLEVAKRLLHEFLVLQQAMLGAASEALEKGKFPRR